MENGSQAVDEDEDETTVGRSWRKQRPQDQDQDQGRWGEGQSIRGWICRRVGTSEPSEWNLTPGLG